MTLPTVADDEQLDALMSDAEQVDRCLAYVADALGAEALVPPVRGSALIGMNDSSVIKLMAPFDGELAGVEQACLQALDGALPVATPRLLSAGTLDGWHYVHMERLPGAELKECWPTLDQTQRLSIAAQLGECVAALHQLPPPVEVPRVDWPTWTAERTAILESMLDGTPAAWVDAVPTLLASTDLAAGQQGWLHTEIMLEHLLVTVQADQVRLSGLFDFEPSWAGPIDYEYASVALFVSGGDPELLSAVLRAEGQSPSAERLFAMAMMHRYGRLGWYQQRVGGPGDLDDWIQTFFGTI